MKATFSMHHNERSLELELILAVCFLALVALIFLVLTFYKRSKKLAKVKRARHYQKIVDDLVFKILFGEQDLAECLTIYTTYENKKLFNKTLIKSLVSLHKSYVGEPKNRIEKFYEVSGLYQFSLKKLKSKSWVNQVEAIRDLSKLNYTKAFAEISALTISKREEIKKESIIGSVLLNGISELEKFKNEELYFDDWMQSNFLYSLKIKQWEIFELKETLFQSKNESFLLLVARIIELYQLHIYYDVLVQMMQNCQKTKTKNDLKNIISRLK